MKKIMLTLFLALPFMANADVDHRRPGPGGHGNHSPRLAANIVQHGTTLANVLNNLSTESRAVSQRAQRNGNFARAQKFRRVATLSQILSVRVRVGVVLPASRGRLGIAKLAKQGMRFQLQQLNQAVRDIRQMPVTMERKIQRARNQNQKLNQLLSRVGGGLFGGNAGGFEF